jgi:hypothetical protein
MHPGQPGVEPSPDKLKPVGGRRIIFSEKATYLVPQLLRNFGRLTIGTRRFP